MKTALVYSYHRQLIRSRNLDFPYRYGTEFETDFDKESEEAIIDMQLPHVSAIPTITRYRYIRQQKKLDEIKLKSSDVRDRYQDLLAQLTLATLFRSSEFKGTDCWTIN